MQNTYLNLLNSKGNNDLRDIVLREDFKKYQRKLKKLITLQNHLKNIENNIFGPIDKIEAFHDLYIYSHFTRQPIITFDLVNNTIVFNKKDAGICLNEDKMVEVCKFNLDKLQIFNEATIFVIRNLYLEKLKQQKNNYISGEFQNGSLERFIILLVSNYEYISYANGDFEKAIANYTLIESIIDFTKDNDSIKNKTLEKFVEIFSECIISNNDIFAISNLELEKPSLDGLKELFNIHQTCLKTCYDELKKEPNYEFLVNEFLDLSKFVIEYEQKISK